MTSYPLVSIAKIDWGNWGIKYYAKKNNRLILY